MTDDSRPTPEALLASLATAGRGRLKVFLGAAPGVGKTYAMLTAAREKHEQGADLVVALVETHRRAETEALLTGLPVLPRRAVAYRGTTLDELDLDAVLARRPALVLVDELAHTNAPGGRHAKRYLDIEELLAAGIDVWTTVNVQHVESLNDAVAQITGVRVRETVPDGFFESADEVEVIDLPPAELLERLNEGKVYVPEYAAAAVQHFFRPGNLAALRELALRHVASRVGDRVRTYMRAHAILGPWPTTERIVVCVSPSPHSPSLVRTAARRAQARHCDWTAVYVKGARHYHLADADRDRVAATLHLAEELGGQAETVPGEDVAAELVRYARAANATEILIGKSLASRWRELLQGSIVYDLIRDSGHIDVYVVTGSASAPAATASGRGQSAEGANCHAYAGSSMAVLLAGGLAALMARSLALPNLSLLFVLPVLYSACTWGLGPSVYSAVACLLVYDFFFVPPYHTFTISNPQDVLAAFMYLLVALTSSRLTARVRDQAEAARRREEQTSAMYGLARRTAAAAALSDVLEAVVTEVARSLNARVAVLLPADQELRQAATSAADIQLDGHDLAAATWAWQHGQPAGYGSHTLPGIPWYCLPLQTGERCVGILAVQWLAPGRPMSPTQRRLLEALAALAAVAIERVTPPV